MPEFRFAIALLMLGLAPLRALAQTPASPEKPSDPVGQICPIIETVAQANALPLDFFVKIIWQESRFQPDVVGPVTRSGERAQGIAQFMPGTALERQLVEPFNPVEALPKSGEFLAELRNEFGNLGLAAAAYNAGPQRVHDFLAGSRDLPAETHNYVLEITGRAVEDWAKPASKETHTANNVPRIGESPTNCRDLVVLLERTPNTLAAEWRNVPSWCRDLRHPNPSVCGPVHLAVINTAGIAGTRGRALVLRPSLR